MNVGVIPATAPLFWFCAKPAKNTMYRVYYTDPKLLHLAKYQDISDLANVLQCCEYLRNQGMVYVTMVSDYQGMTGKPGVKGASSEYVPQMLN